jgi:hypothetical protein
VGNVRLPLESVGYCTVSYSVPFVALAVACAPQPFGEQVLAQQTSPLETAVPPTSVEETLPSQPKAGEARVRMRWPRTTRSRSDPGR